MKLSSSQSTFTRGASRKPLLPFVLLVFFLLASCAQAPPPVSITVTVPADLLVGRTAQAEATTENVTGGVTWTTSDADVATVDVDGLITGVGEGTATITAASTDDPTVSDSADVTVTSVFRGASVLYFVDSEGNPDSTAAALDEVADDYGVNVDETTFANFVTDLGSLDPTLVVYFMQGNAEIPDDNLTALVDWVEAGNPLVFATWDPTHPDSLTVATALEASFTGNENFELMEIENESIASGLSTTTVPVIDAGWGTFSLGLAAEGDGVELAHWYDNVPELTTEAALVSGNEGRTMMVGFLNDAVADADGTTLYTNIFEYVLLASAP